jgi:hypothetical protein
MEMSLRHTLCVLALVLIAAALSGCAPRSSDRVLATVGETRITTQDFLRAVRREPSYRIDPTPDGKETFLEEMIDRALLLDEARRLGFDRGDDYRSVVTEAARRAASDALYEIVVGSRVRVSEAEVRAIWELQDREWRLSQSFVPERAQADAILRLLEQDVPFEQAAHLGAIEPGTRLRGGDVGWVTGGDMPGPVERAVPDLEPGEWTGPLDAAIGYYFVQVTDLRPRQRQTLEVARPAILGTLRLRRERAVAVDYVQSLKARRHLAHQARGYRILAERWQNRTLEEHLGTRGDLDALGFTPEERAVPLATYDGGAYTIERFFEDLQGLPSANRPPLDSDPLLRMHVEDQVVSELLRREAESMQLEQEPAAATALRERGDSYLVDAIYERVVTAEAAARYQANPPDPRTLGDGGAEALFSQLRLQVLRETLTRLRREHPPHVDQRTLDAIPWPVPIEETL